MEDRLLNFLFKNFADPVLLIDKDSLLILEFNERATVHFPLLSSKQESFFLYDIYFAILNSESAPTAQEKDKWISADILVELTKLFDVRIFPKNETQVYLVFETKELGRDLVYHSNSFVEVFREMTSKSTESILLTDLSGSTYAANPAACKMFGYTEEELIQLGRSAIINPQDSRLMPALEFRKAMGTFYGELGFKNKAGEMFDCMVSSSTFKDEFGLEKNILIVHRSDEKSDYVKKLFRENILLQEMSRISKVGIWEFEVATQNLSWSDEIYRIHELERDVVLEPAEAIRFYRNNSAQKISESFRLCLEKKIPYDLTLQFKTAKGKNLWIRTTGQPRLDVQKNVVSVYGLFQDITDQHRMQRRYERVLDRLTQYKSAIYSASIISITDSLGIIKYINRRFEEISQYTSQELVGTTHRIINAGVHPPEMWEEFWTTINSGKIWRGEVCNKKKDGSFYWVDTFVIPLKNKKGRVTEFLSIRNDITKRKNYELQIKTSLKEKERIIQELHHRVKNNLQMIASLARLQSMYFEEGVYTTSLLFFEKRIKIIAGLHEQLLHSENFETAHFGEFMERIVFQSSGFHGKLNFNLNEERKNRMFSIDFVINFGLLCLELILSGFEFYDFESIDVNLIVSDEDFIEVQISFCEKITSENDNLIIISRSFSLELINIFNQQLDSRMTIDTNLGFPISFLIPIEKK